MIVEPDRRQRIARLTPLADVLARLDALVKPVTPRTAELAAALGRTLAEDVILHAPIPATARALRDGWAVSSDLTTDASAYAPAPLPAAVWIDVGEPLPGDADAVAPLDGVAMRDAAAQALAPVGPGEGALPPGAGVAPGARCCRQVDDSAALRSRCWTRRASRRRASARRGYVLCAPRRAAMPSSMPRSYASPTLWPRKAASPPSPQST